MLKLTKITRCFFIIAFFVYFPIILAQTSQPEYFDIKGAFYERTKLYLQLEDQIPRQITESLKKNLLWSGVFDIQKDRKRSALRLSVDLATNKYFLINLVGLDNRSLFRKLVPFSKENLENDIISLVEDIIYKLSRKKSTLGTAIIYAEQRGNEPKRIVVTDTHNRYKVNLVNNKEYNILPKWSPDETAFIYTSNSWRGSRVIYVDLKTKTKKLLIYSRKGISTGGSWNRNNNDIVATVSEFGNPDLYLFSVNGEIKRRLTTFSSIDTSPSLSPNGQDLVFTSNRSGMVQIYKMTLDNTTPKRLSFTGSYNTDPKWSNDGRYIIYAGLRKGIFQLFLMDAYGIEIKRLTYAKKSSEEPSWSPDDRLVIFSSKISGDSKLYIMTLDGRYIRRLTNSPKGVRESNPDWAYNLDKKYIQ